MSVGTTQYMCILFLCIGGTDANHANRTAFEHLSFRNLNDYFLLIDSLMFHYLFELLCMPWICYLSCVANLLFTYAKTKTQD